jgi:hypothetical protein
MQPSKQSSILSPLEINGEIFKKRCYSDDEASRFTEGSEGDVHSKGVRSIGGNQ